MILSAFGFSRNPLTHPPATQRKQSGFTLGHLQCESRGTTFFDFDLQHYPNFTPDGRAGIAVGGPAGQLGGLYNSGGVRVHSLDISSIHSWEHFIEPQADAVVGGENHHSAGARVGARIDAGLRDGRAVLAVSGPGAHSLSTSGGAAWVIEFETD